MAYQTVIRAVNAVTATTESQAINIENATKVIMVYKRSNHTAGSTLFDGTVSADDSLYITYNKWIDNVTNTNLQNLTRVSSKTLSDNGSGFLSLCPEDGFKFLKVKATETTDGTHDIWVIIQYE